MDNDAVASFEALDIKFTIRSDGEIKREGGMPGVQSSIDGDMITFSQFIQKK